MAKKDQEPNVSASPETGTETNPDASAPKKVGRPRKADKDKPDSKDAPAKKTRSKNDDPKDSETVPDKDKNPPATNREAILLAEMKTNDPDKVDEDLKNTLDPYEPIIIKEMTEEDKKRLAKLFRHTDFRLPDRGRLLGHAHKMIEGKHGEYPMGKSIYYPEDKKREVIKAIKDGKKPEEIPNIPEPLETDEAKAQRKEMALKEMAISDEVFSRETRKRWVEIAVHGMYKNGALQAHSDLDGESYLMLLKLAGIDFNPAEVAHVSPGEYKEGYLTGDSGMVDWVESLEDGKTTIVDHHGKESGKDTSATKNIYYLLVKSGLLKQEEYLDRFVQFVTDEDNKNYTDEQFRHLGENMHRTVIGLSDRLDGKEILELFKAGVSRFHVFGDNFLKGHKFYNTFYNKNQTLLDHSNYTKRKMDRSREQLAEMEKEGFIFESGDDRYGLIIIDTGYEKKVQNGEEKTGEREAPEEETELKLRVPVTDVVRAVYPGRRLTLIKWTPGRNSYRIYPSVPFKENEIKFPEGFNARGFWNKPENDPAPVSITLREALEKYLLSGKKINSTGKLKEYIEWENADSVRRNRESMDFSEKELKTLFIWAEAAKECIRNIEESTTAEYGRKGYSKEEIDKKIEEKVKEFWEVDIYDELILPSLDPEEQKKYSASFTMREELLPGAVEKIKFEQDNLG